MKKIILILLLTISLLIIGCRKTTLEEAYEIAQNSECTEKGDLTQEYMYNNNTKTWWIDLDMKKEFEKPMCNPACVVDEETKTAEINWRCTGVII